jgi:pyrimidine-nucleoside phosphorylase
MRMIDIIEHKRDGNPLTNEEIAFFINGYTKGEIPDYQVSALLMAIYFQGMTTAESSALTMAMLHSGETIDLSSIDGVKVDKHSTGGVGDKTTLVLAPLVASVGVKVAKLSGRGLGHTGGTIDKLESIPGLTTSLEPEAFLRQVNAIGLAVAGQTANLTPADKLLYALRDVTGTVPSIPLIASSIMSKKLASGSDAIVLDVKFGEGAFMKTLDDAKELSRVMVNIGAELGKEVVAFITDMNEPLGYTIGNRLEVQEAIETLQGNGPADLTTLCVEIGSEMVRLAGLAPSKDEAKHKIEEAIRSGAAHRKQLEFLRAQGAILPNWDQFVQAKYQFEVRAEQGGHIKTIHALPIGLAAMRLGAGRATKEDDIDPDVGIRLHVKVGDSVDRGDLLATLYANDTTVDDIKRTVLEAFVLSDKPVAKRPIVQDIITA